MKKRVAIGLTCLLCLALATPTFANNYDFDSGPDSKSTFGKPTSNDEPVSPDPMSENTRRNKDAAYTPPPYGIFSGDIPTEPSSLYHDNLPGGSSSGYITGGVSGDYSGLSSSTTAFTLSSSGFTVSTSTVAVNTEPKYYNDDTIGTLYIERTGKTIKVYEGESLDNLKKGAGHFAMTSVWDGNVGLCGHNRGSSAYFSFVKDLRNGDKITYTTYYGTRTYEVFSKEQISENDYSKLGWSAENMLTLITCVENASELRWAAQCREDR